MRVLVCGGRDYDDEARVHATLTALHKKDRFHAVLEGGADGADALGRQWAHGMGIRVETFEANWGAYGKAAGPMRNRRMLEEGRPDLIVAFPGGKGTADMIWRGRQAGVAVLRVES
jgi:hypothetical protein